MIRWRLASPAARATPVAIFELSAEDQSQLDAALSEIASITQPGLHRLAMIAAVDRGLIARPSPTTALLMPHGGPVITRAIERELLDRYGPPTQPMKTDLDARIAWALATTRSPLAIDLLLDQPRKWGSGLPPDAARDSRLAALLEPPTVALWGPPNIGKSTLLNTLAGRSAALVADAPGTTRDHVGVEIEFAGLVCRVLDLPGIRETDDRVEASAIEIATKAVVGADLLIRVGDAQHLPVEPPAGFAASHAPIRLGLRADLAEPGREFDLAISARTGRGMREFVTRVRDAFIPPSDLTSDQPWRFWNDPAVAAP